MGSDALIVNLPSSTHGISTITKKLLRLYTTHLELLWEEPGTEVRPGQLAQISTLLKEKSIDGVAIIGGLGGGDMNHFSFSSLDNTAHKTPEIDLLDVWGGSSRASGRPKVG